MHIIIESPFKSNPVRPAHPLIYLYFVLSINYFPIYGALNITAFAGRLIPVLSVLVAHSTNNVPSLNPFSTISRSSVVKPEWWYATPYGTV